MKKLIIILFVIFSCDCFCSPDIKHLEKMKEHDRVIALYKEVNRNLKDLLQRQLATQDSINSMITEAIKRKQKEGEVTGEPN